MIRPEMYQESSGSTWGDLISDISGAVVDVIEGIRKPTPITVSPTPTGTPTPTINDTTKNSGFFAGAGFIGMVVVAIIVYFLFFRK
jgi:hypothetical protein